jgi:hypothetical protein
VQSLPRRHLSRFPTGLGILAVCAFAFFITDISVADVITVTTVADDVETPPAGSLRKAVMDAVSGDTIAFGEDLSDTIELDGEEILLDKVLTIAGPGAKALAISGAAKSRIFHVAVGVNVTITGLTLRDGKAQVGAYGLAGGAGGAIISEGDLNISNCIFSENQAGTGGGRDDAEEGVAGAGGDGGAIASYGSLSLVRCVLEKNQTGKGGNFLSTYNEFPHPGPINRSAGRGGNGGAIFSKGALTVVECSVIDNQCSSGGNGIRQGMWWPSGGAGGSGGGIHIQDQFAIDHSCIARNRAGKSGVSDDLHVYRFPSSPGLGGGLYVESAAVGQIRTTTVSGNFAGGSEPWLRGTYLAGRGGGIASFGDLTLISGTISANAVDRGRNGEGAGAGLYSQGSTFVANSIISGNDPVAGDVDGAFAAGSANLIGGDAKLGPLANNGGPTATHALLGGSPAVDAGDDSLTGTDQRGYSRLSGAHVDIGAYERDESTLVLLSLAASTAEVSEGSGNYTVTIVRQGVISEDVEVHYNLTGQTAAAGADFQAVSGILLIPAGMSSGTIAVPIVDDAIAEPPETFEVVISVPSQSAEVHPIAVQTVTILDNEGTGRLRFQLAGSVCLENSGSAQIVITRELGSVGSASVNYSTVNGTAIAGTHFAATEGTATFAHGVTQQTVSIPMLDDSEYQGDREFGVVLTDPSAGTSLGTPVAHQVTIEEDEKSPTPRIIQFQVATSTSVEGPGKQVVVYVTCSGPGGAVRVNYATASGSAAAGADFVSLSGQLTFAEGETLSSFTVPLLNDSISEGPESFTVSLFGDSAGAVLGEISTHTITIEDDDRLVTFQSAASTVTEGKANAVVVVECSPGTNAVAIRYTLTSGGALENSDFVFNSGSVRFGPGVTERKITIPILTDNLQEGPETFTVSLYDPSSSAALGGITLHTVTILDAPTSPPLPGTYRGLMAEEFDAQKGLLVLRVAQTGRVTGNLRFGGIARSFRGEFTSSGTLKVVLGPAPRLGWQGGLLTLDHASFGRIEGTFDGPISAESLRVELTRDRVGTAAQPVTDANHFTAVLETNLPNDPAGYFTIRIRDSGAVILRGLLPDGSRQVASSHVSMEDTVLVFCSSYRGHFGSLSGLATFSDDQAPLFGSLSWERPVSTPPLGAFSKGTVRLLGAPFSPSMPGRILGDFDAVNGAAVFRTVTAGGDLLCPLTWNAKNQLILDPPNASRVQLVAQRRDGRWSGTVGHHGSGLSRISGVFVQLPGPANDLAIGFARTGDSVVRAEIAFE